MSDTLTLTTAQIAAACHARAERQRAERAREASADAGRTRLVIGTTILTVLVLFGGAAAIFVVHGCSPAIKTPDPTKIPDQTKPIATAEQTVTTGAADVATRAGSISGHANAAKENTPAAAKPIVWPHLDAILAEVLGLQQDSSKLNGVTQDLAATNVQVGRLQDTVAANAATIKTQGDTIAGLKKQHEADLAHQGKVIEAACYTAIAIGIVFAALAAGAFYTGNSSGAAYLGIVGGACVCSGVTVETYHTQVALACGVLAGCALLAAIADLIYDWVDAKKTNASLTTVGTELTHSVEIAKDQMTPAARAAYTGVGAVADSLLDDAQSAITKLFVKKVKASGAVRTAAPLAIVLPAASQPAK